MPRSSDKKEIPSIYSGAETLAISANVGITS